MTIDEAIKNLKDILEEATEEENSVCYVTNCDGESLELAIKALETVGKIAEIIKFEQQATSCEHTKLKSFGMIENIISDYQLNS